ncbi:hypothetical protein ACFQ10_01070 [Streptomyces indonesiensis]
MLEADTLDGDVPDRVVVGASDLEQRGELRQFDVAVVRVLASGCFVVEEARVRVEVPLARGLEEGGGVLQQEGATGEGFGDGVVAPVVVVPGWLLHGDGGAADALHGRVPVGEGVLALHFDAVLPGQ